MAFRRTLTFALLGILCAASLAAAPVSSAATESRERAALTCKQLNKKYPQGIVSSASGAEIAVSNGFARPAIIKVMAWYALSKKVARSSTALMGIVICPVKALTTAPTTAPPAVVTTVELPPVVSGVKSSGVWNTGAFIYWNRDFTSWPAGSTLTQDPQLEVTGSGTIKILGSDATITGLNPGTTYQFTFVRRNSAGASEAVVLSITTLPADPTPSPTYIPPSIPPSSPTGGLYYPTCADARTAGVSLPIRKSEQPGIYDANPQLDRDGDGVACEWA
jgi:hypothetical protein